MFTIVRFASLTVLLTACTLAQAQDESRTRILPLGGRAPDPARTLSVSGLGRISAQPNVVDINVGVVTYAEQARQALSANNEKMAALQKVLKDRGVAAKDIQTINVVVRPRYEKDRSSQSADESVRERDQRIIGYDVVNVVSVTGREVSKFGDLLDAVATAGANQINGIDFRIDEADTLLDNARKKAMADAKRKADLLAGEAGIVVGEPILINEETNRRPSQQRDVMYSLGTASPARQVPIAAGEEELSVTVHVVYELRSSRERGEIRPLREQGEPRNPRERESRP